MGREEKKGTGYAYFGHEPSTKTNTADLLRPIREARAECESSGKETSKDGICGNEHVPVQSAKRDVAHKAQTWVFMTSYNHWDSA